MTVNMVANLPRLRTILDFLNSERIAQPQINMATYLVTHRTDEERAPVGCVLGHYARSGRSELLSLVPVRFWAQVKSPIMLDVITDEFPRQDWQHWTLHLQTPSAEAFGETAAALYTQLGTWDLHRLFYPAGSSYEVRPTLFSLAFRLRTMVETTR